MFNFAELEKKQKNGRRKKTIREVKKATLTPHYKNHYDYLEKHLPTIFKTVGINWDWNGGIIGAHGDKGYCYKNKWEKAGIDFCHGMVLYLMTYCQPYSDDVRQTKEGFKDPSEWVIENYNKFKNILPQTENTHNIEDN